MNDPFLSRLSTNHKSRLNIKTIKSVKAQKTLLKSEETICWLYTIYTMEDVSLFRCGDCQHRRFLLKESLAPQLYYILHVYGRDPSLAGDWIVLIVGCCASCAQYPVQYSTGLQESHKTNELALPIHHLYSPPSYTLSSHRVTCSKHAPRLASFKSLLKPHYKWSDRLNTVCLPKTLDASP